MPGILRQKILEEANQTWKSDHLGPEGRVTQTRKGMRALQEDINMEDGKACYGGHRHQNSENRVLPRGTTNY